MTREPDWVLKMVNLLGEPNDRAYQEELSNELERLGAVGAREHLDTAIRRLRHFHDSGGPR
jgi:hypothetical protein